MVGYRHGRADRDVNDALREGSAKVHVKGRGGTSLAKTSYIPPLRFRVLTPAHDLIVRWTSGELAFRAAIVDALKRSEFANSSIWVAVPAAWWPFCTRHSRRRRSRASMPIEQPWTSPG